MTNTMNFNKEEVQQTVAAVYADLKANNVKLGNMDEMFAAVNRYVTITREQFEDYYKQLNECRELDEAELDMVAGGSFKEFICSPLGLVTIIAAGVLIGTGIGAAGFGIAAMLSAGGAAAGTAAAGTAATAGAIGAATLGEAAFAGGFFGFFAGAAAGCVTSIALDQAGGNH